MMFNQYPYLNLNDLNLDYILSQIKVMMNEVTNFVSINAIKYADPIQWDITRQYEKNTVVIDPVTGTAYISVAPVPAGVALTRPEYWTVVFDLGSFVTRAAQNFTSRYEQDTTLTATFPTNTGEWLVWGDVLYIALSNINVGDQYVVDGNIEHITIENVYHAAINTIMNNFTDNVEITGYSTRNYSSGNWLVITDKLYRATTTINIGDTFVVNTNVVPYTVNDFANDIYTYIRNVIDIVNSNITSNVEGESMSSRSYSAGNWLVYNDKLYRATTTINIGDALVIGTNITPYNINDFVNEIWSFIDNEIIDKTSLASRPKYLTVGSRGCRFTSVNSAITYARDYCSESNRVCIVITEGHYNENITLFPNYGIDLIGIGEVVIEQAAIYPYSPLYVAGNILVENIHFHASHSDTPTYGMHIEAAAQNCTMRFVDCIFSSEDVSGLGFGTASGMDITFVNCKFISIAQVPVYGHNYPGPENAIGQNVSFYGCEFLSGNASSPDVTVDDARYRRGYENTTTSLMSLSFAGCIFNKGQFEYREVDTNDQTITTLHYLSPTKQITLKSNSRGTLYSVDSERYNPHIKTTTWSDAAASSYVPFPNANLFNWTVTDALAENGDDISGAITVFSTDEKGIRINTTLSYTTQNVVVGLEGFPI